MSDYEALRAICKEDLTPLAFAHFEMLLARVAELAELERHIDEDLISIKSYCELGIKHERAVLALRSISSNTCCGPCREAALVAQQALADIAVPKRGPNE